MISVKVGGMDTQDVPAAALLMAQFRRLTTLLLANDVTVEDLEYEVRLAAERAAAPIRPRLHIVPAAG